MKSQSNNRSFLWLGLLAAFSLTTSCTTAEIRRHVAATDYTGTPHRIMVVNDLDESFDTQIRDTFAVALTERLSQCGVSASVITRPPSLELNAEAKLAAKITDFKPDTLLNMQQTNRNLLNGDVRSGAYTLTLRDVATRRDIWKGQGVVASSAAFLVNRKALGPELALDIVRQLATDNILKGCSPLPSKA